MSPLIYLVTRKAKNRFSELLKKPGKLILTLAFIVLLVMNLSFSSVYTPGTRDITEFYALIYIFYILCFVTEVNKGFHHGGTMFSMADVSFLFMSPVRSSAVLLFGMAGRLGTSLWMGLAFIYQFTLFRTYYPITVSDMLVSVLGYGAVAFFSQLAGVLVYFFTCGEKSKLKKVRTLFYGVYMLFALAFAVRLINVYPVTLADAAGIFTSSFMKAFPVAGWVFSAVKGVFEGKLLNICTGSALCLALTVFCFVVLSVSKHGYYEDVLLTAEKHADSKLSENTSSEVKIQKGDCELKRGHGASAFFYKHCIENRRTKTALLSPTSFFYLVLIGVYGFLFKSDFSLLFTLSCTVSIITVLSGRWIKELTLPYIYLVPEPPVKKLFFMLPELLPKIITESVLQCALIGFICKTGIFTVLSFTLARMAFCFVLLSSALFTSKFFREREKNNIFAAVCVFIGIIFSLPSVICCFLSVSFGMGLIFAFLIMTLINILVSALLLFSSRNLLKISQ